MYERGSEIAATELRETPPIFSSIFLRERMLIAKRDRHARRTSHRMPALTALGVLSAPDAA